MESGYKNDILCSQLVQVPRQLSGKDSTCNARDLDSIPSSGRFPWRRKWQPTPIFLPGEFHGQRSLVDYSPWDRKESEMMEQLTYNVNSVSYSFLVLSIILLPDIREQGTQVSICKDYFLKFLLCDKFMSHDVCAIIYYRFSYHDPSSF